MSEPENNLRFEIGHVLFIDIVGYSKLLIEEQRERLNQLTAIVLATAAVREASDEQLVRVPTGDGMALVFHHSAEEPARCALEIAETLQKHPELPVRMGIHSGPVSEVTDVSGRTNIAGAGINMAQRVMDCGDAGHILMSQHVADDLMQYRQWAPRLRDLGDCEVKHGVRLHLVNLYAEPLGNPDPPEKLKCAAAPVAAAKRPQAAGTKRLAWHEVVLAVLLLIALIVGGYFFLRHRGAQQESNAARAQPAPSFASTVPDKSIAVLPFENLSEEKANAFFADGVQDEILTDLANIADLKVISRTSVMQYKAGARNLREIGQQLGVAHLLEGSVQRAANKIRVNAQLIDARNDAHLWAQTYDRDLADVFAIQSEIARAIAEQLQAKILPQERKEIDKQPTTDITARDLCVQAINEIDASPDSDQPREELLRAVDLLDQAVRRDSKFVRAYCQLARAHDLLYIFGIDHTPQRLALAEEAVAAAARLEPDASEVHLARASHLYSKLDYDGARAEIDLVLQRLPNEPGALQLSGFIDRRQGRWQESTRSLERAVELDPRNSFLLHQTATGYNALREHAKAARLLERVLTFLPGDVDTLISRGQTDVIWKGDPHMLHETIASAASRDPANARRLATGRIFLAFAERDAKGGLQALADLGDKPWGPDAFRFPGPVGEGIFSRLNGDDAAAQAHFAQARAVQEKVVATQPNYGPALSVLAWIDAQLGRKDEAIREAKRAVDLLPLSKDAVNGARAVAILASASAWVGEKDLALEQLERAAQLPSGVTYGELKLFPQWDIMRGDPHFEKIVASLAPKQ